MQRPTTLPYFHDQKDMNLEQDDDSLENHPLFTSDLEYFTPPTDLTLNQNNGYCSHTLISSNIDRQTILPSFPLSSSNLNNIQQTNTLLLSNVPKQELSELQLASRTSDTYLSTFQLIETNVEIIDPISETFMISIYRQLLSDLSLKWKISIPILDYNIARLRQCTKKCLEQLHLFSHLPLTATFSIEELSLALEFYLQIDVDLFYFKTCWFRQAKPIEETIFCLKLPEIQYSLIACNKSNCTCCYPLHPRIYPEQKQAIQFNLKEKYQFLNGYQTILNCPATCETTNIIYVLRCPCEKFEYIGVTTQSFRDCLIKHRYESNRIMREFIFGTRVTQHILQGNKSEEQQKNDRMWLYQHTAQCSVAIQLFLDGNPDYWCLVPMSNEEARLRINTVIPPSYRRERRMQLYRNETDAVYLAKNLPDPPESYTFTNRQKYAHVEFFYNMKDQLLLPPSLFNINIDLYNASIIAVLPENCSEMFRQLILSLFITHTDCNLNQTGRLINQTMHHAYPVFGHWCANLIRRPLSSLS